MTDKTLEVLLTEYKVLREGMTKKFDREIQLFTIVVSALGVIYGIIFANEVYDMFLFIPVIISPLALKFKYGAYGVKKFSKYLAELEEQISAKIQDEKWIGFQHSWDKLGKERKLRELFYDASSKVFLLIFVPMGISVLYSAYLLSHTDLLFSLSKLNQNIHTGAITIYLVIIILTVLWYYVYGGIKLIVEKE